MRLVGISKKQSQEFTARFMPQLRSVRIPDRQRSRRQFHGYFVHVFKCVSQREDTDCHRQNR